MTLLEFKRPDGEPFYCWLEAISVWMAASDKEYAETQTEIWVGGKMFRIAHTVREVTKILEEA